MRGLVSNEIFIPLHCIALHCIALHCIALHCIALHCIALHCIALHCIVTLRYITLHTLHVTLHVITSHHITSHHITCTLHYITLHYITLHYITSHYIKYYFYWLQLTFHDCELIMNIIITATDVYSRLSRSIQAPSWFAVERFISRRVRVSGEASSRRRERLNALPAATRPGRRSALSVDIGRERQGKLVIIYNRLYVHRLWLVIHTILLHYTQYISLACVMCLSLYYL